MSCRDLILCWRGVVPVVCDRYKQALTAVLQGLFSTLMLGASGGNASASALLTACREALQEHEAAALSTMLAAASGSPGSPVKGK